MTTEPCPPRRRWHAGWWLVGFVVLACAWAGWREYDYRAAISEAKAAGWHYESGESAMRMATWTDRYRRLGLPIGTDLATAGPLLSRLRPTSLVALRCPDTHLDALRGLTALQRLDLSASSRLQIMALNNIVLPPIRRGISLYADELLSKGFHSHSSRNWWPYDMYEPWRDKRTLRGLPVWNDFNLYSTGLQDVDALRGLSALRELDLHGCMGLQNVDGLRGLPALTMLDLSGCTGLQNVDALRGLRVLRELNLSACSGLQNADGLRDLPALQRLNLTGCNGLSAPALRELRVALPEARIDFPDGTLDPPQPKREVWLWGVSVVLPTDEDGGE